MLAESAQPSALTAAAFGQCCSDLCGTVRLHFDPTCFCYFNSKLTYLLNLDLTLTSLIFSQVFGGTVDGILASLGLVADAKVSPVQAALPDARVIRM